MLPPDGKKFIEKTDCVREIAKTLLEGIDVAFLTEVDLAGHTNIVVKGVKKSKVKIPIFSRIRITALDINTHGADACYAGALEMIRADIKRSA